MKRVHGVFLLFASLLVFWLLLNGTQVRDAAASLIGLIAAVVVALAIAGGLCFLAQCRATPRTFAAALLRTPHFAKELAKAISAVAHSGRVGGRMQGHRTQGREP
ncbi:MAG: Na+/H+ antiporter subunit E [Alphaproteobacteria bacterium]|nr:Na+/H+ antiporter subunit E [Alphaproteobacteria bacterium]MDE2111115.1 Na+/H+ antiporter subunit E [Alphaproteobacteria bacterium]